jgi:hypothetical protein
VRSGRLALAATACVRQGFFDYLLSAGSAAAAAGSHAQFEPKLEHRIRAVANGVPDLTLCDSVAKADVHGFKQVLVSAS